MILAIQLESLPSEARMQQLSRCCCRSRNPPYPFVVKPLVHDHRFGFTTDARCPGHHISHLDRTFFMIAFRWSFFFLLFLVQVVSRVSKGSLLQIQPLFREFPVRRNFSPQWRGHGSQPGRDAGHPVVGRPCHDCYFIVAGAVC